jgi:hypothetical protein
VKMRKYKGKIDGPEFRRRLAAKRRIREQRGSVPLPAPRQTSGTEVVTVLLAAVNDWQTDSNKPMRFVSWRVGSAHVEAVCFDERFFASLSKAVLDRKPVTLDLRYGSRGHIKIIAVLP